MRIKKTKLPVSFLHGATLTWVLLLCSTEAFAQSGGKASQENANTPSQSQLNSDTFFDDDAIIVTANKRDERLLDVASAVSAVTGDELDRRQLLDLQDLAKVVPGLSINASGISTKITIRGLSSSGDGATVATVLDDVPLSFSGANTQGGFLASDFDTYDLERVEVLRGPQGTLYGATAEGGLVKYVTARPRLGLFQAGFEAGALNIAHGGSSASGKAYVNLPLGKSVAARATGFYEGLPGFIRNDFLQQRDVNEGKRYGGRVSVLFEPSPNFSVRTTALYQRRKTDGSEVLRVFGDTQPSDPLEPVNGYDASGYSNNTFDSKLQLYYLDLAYNTSWAKFQSITSYGKSQNRFVLDRPTFPPILAQFGLPPSQVTQFDRHNLRKFNQELRLSSQSGSTISNREFAWQLGGFYTDENVDYKQNFPGRTYPGGVLLPPPFDNVASDSAPSRFRDIAGFASLDYYIFPNFDVEIGGRIARNKQRSQIEEAGLLFSGGPTVLLPAVNTSETVKTYSVAARLRFAPDVISYARVASGYRPGGPQFPIIGQPPGVPTEFGSDSTTNYELGVKGKAFERLLTFDVAAFYIDWNDIQISQVVNVVNPVTGVSTPYSITGNAGKAVSRGVEWTVALRPGDGFEIQTAGAYTDAHLSATPPAGSAGSKDDKLPYVPEFSNTLSADYFTALGESRLTIGGSWTYTSARQSEFVLGGSQTKLPSYNDFSIFGGVEWQRYALQIYVKNLSDSKGILNYGAAGALGPSITSPISYGSIAITRPRTIGIRFTSNF